MSLFRTQVSDFDGFGKSIEPHSRFVPLTDLVSEDDIRGEVDDCWLVIEVHSQLVLAHECDDGDKMMTTVVETIRMMMKIIMIV